MKFFILVGIIVSIKYTWTACKGIYGFVKDKVKSGSAPVLIPMETIEELYRKFYKAYELSYSHSVYSGVKNKISSLYDRYKKIEQNAHIFKTTASQVFNNLLVFAIDAKEGNLLDDDGVAKDLLESIANSSMLFTNIERDIKLDEAKKKQDAVNSLRSRFPEFNSFVASTNKDIIEIIHKDKDLFDEAGIYQNTMASELDKRKFDRDFVKLPVTGLDLLNHIFRDYTNTLYLHEVYIRVPSDDPLDDIIKIVDLNIEIWENFEYGINAKGKGTKSNQIVTDMIVGGRSGHSLSLRSEKGLILAVRLSKAPMHNSNRRY